MKTITFLRNSFKIFTLFALIGVVSSASDAQTRVNGLTTTTFTSPFATIVGGPNTFSTGACQGCISNRYGIGLPFAFTYDGTVYTQGSTLWINENGSVSFVTGVSTYYDRIVPYFGNAASNYPNTIGVFNGLQYPITGVGGGIFYQTSGAVGNRVLTIEWNNTADYWNTAKRTSYQLKLYEGTNVIEFWYQDYGFSLGGEQSSYYFNVGLNGGTSPSFVQNITINGTTNFATPATNYRYSVPLPVELSTTPKTLNFGPLPTGTNGTLNLTITNAGAADGLKINSLTITGSSDFAITGGTPVPPLVSGQSWPITVQFTPSGNGIRAAVLTVVSNGLDSGTQTINMNGTGLTALIAVDSVVRFKKTRTRLGESLTQWVHITNTGQSLLNFSGFPITGIDANQYTISQFPANPIYPGTTDSLAITYVPTLEGKHVATLTINSNAFNTPSLAISLQGTGTLPHIAVTPGLLLFDSTREGDTVCKNITIWNPGTDTLRIKANFLSSNDGDFHYTGLSGSDLAIPPDHTKIVSVCFIPLQQGTRQARLLLKTNIINTFDTPRQDTAGIVTVDIRGTGVPFGVFANAISGLPVLDSALINTQVCRMDTLKNNGDADIMVTGFTFTGGVFTQTGLPATPFLLKARTWVVFDLCGTPTVQGLAIGSLTFTGTTGGKTIAYGQPLGVFGLKACVSATPSPLFDKVLLPLNGSDSILCITVTNCGDIAATYTPTISGNGKNDYSFKPASSPLIQPKGTTQFCVDFKPSSDGISNASFDVSSTDKSSVSVPLAGSGGCAIVTPSTPQVPNTGVLAKSKFDVTITNSGTFDWTAGTASVNPTPGPFSVLSLDKPTATMNNGVIVVHMQFAPTALGNASAILSFPTAGPCEKDTIHITLNGLGIVNSVGETTAEGFSLNQSYPNPAQGKANFTYTTPRETEVRISIVDLSGKLVRTLITGRVSQGEHLVNFDASNLPSGTYIYMLESGSTRLVRQLILTK